MVIWNFYSTKGLKYKIEGFLQTVVKYLEKFISKGCTSRLWGFYYLSRLQVDLLHKISSRVIWLAGKKGGCKFGMTCPNLDVGAGFIEVRKHKALALPTLEQTGTQVLEE